MIYFLVANENGRIDVNTTAEQREYIAYHYAISGYTAEGGSQAGMDRALAFLSAVLTDERTGLTHVTPASDVSDEALAEIYHKAARDEADRQRDAKEWAHSDSKTWHDQMIQCGAAGIRAVRASSAAVDVPDWVEELEAYFNKDGTVEVDLLADYRSDKYPRDDPPTWRRRQNGTGPTLAAAIADAGKGVSD